ncbi:MAG TPA: 16S rRNA (cytosine(1402)-N(4))-methyltransferase RsmH [Candidatus Paceibacterota bacterium]|nr:16S rRNA (cytosine(1402)-N(4))-methyltransferase RsmH [Candidatus Paceibacterota bacterium]
MKEEKEGKTETGEVISSVHKTVLLNETIDGLNLSAKSRAEMTVLDGTFGGGGHSAEICRKFPGIKIIAIDQDKSAFKKAENKFKGLNCKLSLHNVNFKDLAEVLKEEGVEKVDGIILDLGLSSDQLENSGRGFSFMKDEPLLMTMKASPTPEDLTAIDVVNTWEEKNLADVIYGYGEEKYARRIAREIVAARKNKKIETTFDLVEIIKKAVPVGYQRGRLHFVTRTFQAIRIAVNNELGVLQEGLVNGFEVLKEGGRMSVISFHSLEDRIVKNFYKQKVKESKAVLVNKKPILASDEEQKDNPRSRSAKLRVLEKI